MQSRPILDRQEHVLRRNKCGNLKPTLRSCFSNKFLPSWVIYLNFTPNYFKLNFPSDEITFVYVNCVIVKGPEHPTNSDIILNNELCKISDWLSSNKLSLNVKKPKYMVFHTPRKKVIYPTLK